MSSYPRISLFKEDPEASRQSLFKCLEFIQSCTVVSSAELAGLAFDIALECRTTFYDSLFLAASERKNVPLITLDRKMHERAQARSVDISPVILSGLLRHPLQPCPY